MASVSAFQLLLGYRASPPTTCGGREFLASALDNVKHGERETNVCDHRADESKEQSEGTVDVLL
jgi:hypothetical protein